MKANSSCYDVREFWKDIESAKNKGELLWACRKVLSHYGMHSNMPKDVWDKLESATTHFYR